MKIRRFSVIICLLVFVNISSAAEMAGQGTKYSPYLIENCEQLQRIGKKSEAVYKLSENIDCSETRNWNSGKGFDPVNFSGKLKGNGKSIQDLYINRPDTEQVGLFGSTNGARISNLKLVDPHIKGGSYTGGLIGYNLGVGYERATAISNVAIKQARINGGSSTGGLIGTAQYTHIRNVYVGGRIEGESNTGGIIGNAATPVTTRGRGGIRSSLTSAYSDASVIGENNVGGLVGQTEISKIKRSKFNGSVSGEIAVGGIAGISRGKVGKVVSSGKVTGQERVGGIVGELWCGGTISGSSSSSAVEGKKSGAIAGRTLIGGAMCGKPSVENTEWVRKRESEAYGEVISLSTEGVRSLGSKTSEFLELKNLGPDFDRRKRVNREEPELPGEGTSGNPYKISRCGQLSEIRKNLKAWYVLTQNIICENYRPVIENAPETPDRNGPGAQIGGGLGKSKSLYYLSLKENESFEPIGSEKRPFGGTFNGRGYKIKFLVIRGKEGQNGMFNVVTGEVKNLELENIRSFGKSNSALLAEEVAATAEISNIGIYNSKVIGETQRGLSGLTVINRGRIQNIYADIVIEVAQPHSVSGTFGANPFLIAHRNRGKINGVYWSERSKIKEGIEMQINKRDLGKYRYQYKRLKNRSNGTLEKYEIKLVQTSTGLLSNIGKIKKPRDLKKQLSTFQFSDRWKIIASEPRLRNKEIERKNRKKQNPEPDKSQSSRKPDSRKPDDQGLNLLEMLLSIF